MNLRSHSFSYPFTIITSRHLGVTYSSLTQMGAFHQSHSFGQAKVKCYVNIANGNLVIADHELQFPDIGDPINISYVYNSLNNVWNLAASRAILSVDVKTSIIVIEADRAEVEYQYYAIDDCYYAPGHAEGIPYITYNENKNIWRWYHP